ncbi:hypothetical protein [Sphingomonas faeni]|uniref:hypothetical protein n=1 Tax=Sphingomonas faeni TaxID=185950 RepID=UPI0020C04E3C|nr:hypothetical protein [Sphingomonas faeni]MCK8455294.1 hypothetical protein [Sphingomonas faeni]
MGIPWSELATLIRVTDRTSEIGASREILQEGPLHRVVETVAAMPRDARRGLSVSLPDRRVRPHTFDRHEIDALIMDLGRSRQ